MVVNKLHHFKYVILTEHVPDTDFEPNLDIISGRGIRLKKHSGLDLLKAPFHLRVKQQKTILKQNAATYGGEIITTIYTMF